MPKGCFQRPLWAAQHWVPWDDATSVLGPSALCPFPGLHGGPLTVWTPIGRREHQQCFLYITALFCLCAVQVWRSPTRVTCFLAHLFLPSCSVGIVPCSSSVSGCCIRSWVLSSPIRLARAECLSHSPLLTHSPLSGKQVNGFEEHFRVPKCHSSVLAFVVSNQLVSWKASDLQMLSLAVTKQTLVPSSHFSTSCWVVNVVLK